MSIIINIISNVNAAECSCTTYNSCQSALNSPECDIIYLENDIYTVNEFIIKSKTLDCNLHSINGWNNHWTSVSINDGIIRNCIINNYDLGINVSGESIINNVKIKGTKGVYVGNNLIISDFDFSGVGTIEGYGISATNSNITINNVNVKNAKYGLILNNSNANITQSSLCYNYYGLSNISSNIISNKVSGENGINYNFSSSCVFVDEYNVKFGEGCMSSFVSFNVPEILYCYDINFLYGKGQIIYSIIIYVLAGMMWYIFKNIIPVAILLGSFGVLFTFFINQYPLLGLLFFGSVFVLPFAMIINRILNPELTNIK